MLYALTQAVYWESSLTVWYWIVYPRGAGSNPVFLVIYVG